MPAGMVFLILFQSVLTPQVYNDDLKIHSTENGVLIAVIIQAINNLSFVLRW